MASTFALLGLSLFTALATSQPTVPVQSQSKNRQYQLICQVVLHRANGEQQLVMEPHLCTGDGGPAEFLSGGQTGAGRHFGTYLSDLATSVSPTQVRLKAAAELSKHLGGGVVEVIIHFRCDKVVEPGKPVHLRKKDPKNPNQFYRATFVLTEISSITAPNPG